MERADRAPVSTFYAPGAWTERVELDEDAAHHASVKRMVVGDVVRLTSGDGRRATGTMLELGKRRLVISVDADSLEAQVLPSRVELWAPVGDRERMLLLAEKAVELGASSWAPVIYRRSRSVTPRGEGEPFQQKVRLRQVNALEQCGGAWLPTSIAERTLNDALGADANSSGGSRLLLDADGESLGSIVATIDSPVRIALGPEGGLDEAERAQFLRAGWRTASLGANVLRFETAGIAALAIIRSHFR
ncbi:MAG: RsmE family RNA methyltransferase [bacterium]